LDSSFLFGLIGLIVGLGLASVFFWVRAKQERAETEAAQKTAARILEEAKKDASAIRKEAELHAKDSVLRERAEFEKEVRDSRRELQNQERRLIGKEEAIDKRLESVAAVPVCDMEVIQIDREMQQVAADAGNLSRIAEATGGKSLWSTDDLSVLAAALPDRSIERPSDIEEPIWDTRLMAFLLIGLLSMEWILRRSLSLP